MRRYPENLESKKSAILDSFGISSQWVIALSGGVDSSVLLALAVEALGSDRILSVTAHSEAVVAAELQAASAVAACLGARHRVVKTDEMSNPAYRANRGDRCYHCRRELFDVLGALAHSQFPGQLAYGAILDDLGDDRPGMRAAAELGVAAPLLDAGLTKQDVRELAVEYRLPVADRPANACLASRVPAGIPVAPELLRRIDRAEESLAGMGFRGFRVRAAAGRQARVELDTAGLDRVKVSPFHLERLVAAVEAAGFSAVEIDPKGYRPGGANDAELGAPVRLLQLASEPLGD